jgi:hypothetical protein
MKRRSECEEQGAEVGLNLINRRHFPMVTPSAHLEWMTAEL